MNYTEEQTRKLVEMYKAKPSMLTVEDLAIAMVRVLNQLLENYRGRAYMKELFTRTRAVNYLLQRLRSLATLLRIWDLKLSISRVSRKLQNQHLKNLKQLRVLNKTRRRRPCLSKCMQRMKTSLARWNQ